MDIKEALARRCEGFQMNEFKLVPMEPTEAMIEAARDQHEGEPYLPVSLYKAMLAAAPDMQGEVGEGVREMKRYAELMRKASRELSMVIVSAERLQLAKMLAGSADELEQEHSEPVVQALVEALEQCIVSMLDTGYRSDSISIRAARRALAAHRKQGGG